MKLEPFNRQVQVFLGDLTSPKARSARLAQVAREGIADIRTQNRGATGSDPDPTVFVDGRKGGALESVKPDGRIVAEFDVVVSVLEWIGEALLLESPRLTGRYQRSHELRADGRLVDPVGTIPSATRYEFTNIVPYARKIEPGASVRDTRRLRGKRRQMATTAPGQSAQSPDGVYAAVSAVAATRFGNIAKIRYRLDRFNQATGYSHPSIEVEPR